MELQTKRLKIIALATEQMKLLCEEQSELYKALGLSGGSTDGDEHLREAYREMYAQCLAHEADYLWYTNWQIVLKSENRSIGSIGFLGVPNDKYEVEVGYGIDGEYRGQGYAAEALAAVCEWAFSNGAYYVQACTEKDNEASQKVLQKCSFAAAGERGENLLFELEKPQTANLSIYMCLGLSVGLCLGLCLDNMAIGMCIGLAIGTALGVSLDAADNGKRKR